jgi:hypothetical protein
VELDEIREVFERVPTDRTLEVACGTIEAGTCGALRTKREPRSSVTLGRALGAEPLVPAACSSQGTRGKFSTPSVTVRKNDRRPRRPTGASASGSISVAP